MRVFAVVTEEKLSCAGQSALGRELLAYAVERVWGIPCPKIAVGESGKPYFPEERDKFFSISHTKGCVAVGVHDHELGLDAETVRPYEEKTAAKLFSPGMLSAFGYFGGWTLRESVFKLTGEGSLRRMEFRLENGEIAAPFPGVKCRLYGDIPGCALAAACYQGDFAEKIEIVSMSVICS